MQRRLSLSITLFAGVLFLLTHQLLASFSYAAVSPTDRAALVALYNSTNGDGWANSIAGNNKWDIMNPSSDPCTQWYQVTCNTNDPQRVVALVLDSNGLSGFIPTEMGDLTRLQTLSLSANALTGAIPASLGNLDNLFNLYLDQNSLTGRIPSELGNLSALETLALYQNSLSGTIPPELSNLSAIQDLVLYTNSLTGEIPSELGNLVTLQILYLDDNKLCGKVPSSLASLDGLAAGTGLDINNNNLYTEVAADLDTFIIAKSNGFGTGDWKDSQTPRTCFSWTMFMPAIFGGAGN